MKKKLTLVVSLLLVMALSIGGTLAYLTDTASVENTFTIGNIDITLKEFVMGADNKEVEATEAAQKQFKVIPGGKDAKRPEITVEENSEACYLYVCITNTVKATVNGSDTVVASVNVGSDWEAIAEQGDMTLYRYKNTVASSKEEQKFTVFTEVTYDGKLITEANRADITAETDKITVAAFAHQSDSVDTAIADKAVKDYYKFTA